MSKPAAALSVTVGFFRWLAFSLLGLIAVSVIFSPPLSAAGGGYGTGVFSYVLRASTRPDQDDDPFWWLVDVNIEARTDSRFKLWGHKTPQYEEAKINWTLRSKSGASEGHALVFLTENAIQQNGNSVPLSTPGLKRIIGGKDELPDSQDEYFEALVDFLHSCRDGNLPPPQHHGLTLPPGLSGRFSHGAVGYSLTPFQVCWIAICISYGLIRLIDGMRALLQPPSQPSTD